MLMDMMSLVFGLVLVGVMGYGVFVIGVMVLDEVVGFVKRIRRKG